MTKTIWAGKVEGDRYLHEDVQVEVNKWTDIPPYATEQYVMIQDFDNNVSLGWVEAVTVPGEDGFCKNSSLRGSAFMSTEWPKPIRCYMIIPFPFEEHTGWHIITDEDEGRAPKKGRPYIVAVEVNEYSKSTYKLATAYYKPGRYHDWIGYDYRDGTRTVIAWREFPRPKKC